MGFLEEQEINEYLSESERSNKEITVSRDNFARQLKDGLGAEMLQELRKQPEPPKKESRFAKIMKRLTNVLS